LKHKRIPLIIAIAVPLALMNMQVIKDCPEANKCFAILIFSTILWASEVFVTSTLVPLLLVVFRVIRSEDENPVPLSTPEVTGHVYPVMYSLTISGAPSKTNIALIRS